MIYLFSVGSNFDSNNLNNNDDNISSSGRMSLFLDNLIKCVSDWFVKDHEYCNEDYLYFKHFLFNTSIWYCRNYLNNKLLSSYMDDLTDKLLLKQKEYVRQCIENESPNDNENSTSLCSFCEYNDDNVDIILMKIELRQHYYKINLQLFVMKSYVLNQLQYVLYQ